MLLSKIIQKLQQYDVAIELIGVDVDVTHVASLNKADSNSISFLSDAKQVKNLHTTKASAVILSQHHVDQVDLSSTSLLKVTNPYYIYALVAQLLHPNNHYYSGQDASAVLDATSEVHPSVSLAQNAVVQARSKIAENTVIGAGAVIEQGAIIGRQCVIGSNVTIAHDCVIGDFVTIEAGSVIGSDGFGWANNAGFWVKIPQIGKVVIGNHVAIGSNVTVDRGTIDDTVIEDNCIIDNLVQIAHNVTLKKGCALAAQVGIAGSTRIGEGCTAGGQAGFAGHIDVVGHCHFYAKTGVTNSITEPGSYAGFPAEESKSWQKNSIRVRQLNKTHAKIKQLQKQLATLEKELQHNGNKAWK